jgi:uncharacterized surface protein with fasciclin (FAS1) repeats
MIETTPAYFPMANIIDTLLDTQELEIFSTALQIAGLDKQLDNVGNFTIFAPNNRAFTQLSQLTLQNLSQNISLLITTLSNHIIHGKLRHQYLLKMYDLGKRTMVRTSIDGLRLTIDLNNGIAIDKSSVLSVGKSTDNAIVYPIDRVIMTVS